MSFLFAKRVCWGCVGEFERRDLFELYEVRESNDHRLVCRTCAERIVTEALDAYQGALLVVEPVGGTWNEYTFMRPAELRENNWSEAFVDALEGVLSDLRATCERCGRPANSRFVDPGIYGGAGPFGGVLNDADLERDETLCGKCAADDVFVAIDALKKPPAYIGLPLSNRFGIWTSSQM